MFSVRLPPERGVLDVFFFFQNEQLFVERPPPGRGTGPRSLSRRKCEGRAHESGQVCTSTAMDAIRS